MTADPRVGEVRDVPLAYRPENRQEATNDLIRMLTTSSDIPGIVRLPREAANLLLTRLQKRDEALADLDWERRRVARLTAAVKGVLALHTKMCARYVGGVEHDVCGVCWDPTDKPIWPCPTVAAIRNGLEGE